MSFKLNRHEHKTEEQCILGLNALREVVEDISFLSIRSMGFCDVVGFRCHTIAWSNADNDKVKRIARELFKALQLSGSHQNQTYEYWCLEVQRWREVP